MLNKLVWQMTDKRSPTFVRNHRFFSSSLRTRNKDNKWSEWQAHKQYSPCSVCIILTRKMPFNKLYSNNNNEKKKRSEHRRITRTRNAQWYDMCMMTARHHITANNIFNQRIFDACELRAEQIVNTQRIMKEKNHHIKHRKPHTEHNKQAEPIIIVKMG